MSNPLAGFLTARRRLLSPGTILFAAFLAASPLLVRGPSCGHDFDFHLASWFDALHSWSHGILYPHWAQSSNYGAGEPLFVFYPPLSWMLGAALGAVLPWSLVPFAITFVLLAGTGFGTRALARYAMDEGPAVLAGCFAIFSGYALFDAIERADYGELAGGLWIPLLLLFVLRDRQPSAGTVRRTLDGSTVPLALVFAAAWLSNAPLGVIASYLLAAVALVTAFLWRSWAPILRCSIAVVLGFCVAAFYLVPAAYEQRWVDVHAAISDPSEQIHNSWFYAFKGDSALADHDMVLRSASLICLAMLTLALLGLLVSGRRRVLPGPKAQNRARWWIPLALVPPAIFLLQLPFSAPLWNHLPKLEFLQFPWRWLVAMEAPMAIFCAAALWPAGLRHRMMRFASIAATACLIAAGLLLASHNFYQVCDDQDAVAPMLTTYQEGTGFQGDQEYAPRNTNLNLLSAYLPFACFNPNPTIPLGVYSNDDEMFEWDASQRTCLATFSAAPTARSPEHLSVLASAPRSGYLILRLCRFPAWQILVNGRPPARLPARDDGLFAVPVPAGPVQLSLNWSTTPDVLAGRGLTALALVLLVVLFAFERKSSRARLS
ncbi:MAG TPA: 6-pyruvoyl-tetrahydropterin synthase-related protein [Terracidiphilus sp.]|nr:6-pyruvoyl-tetrahydropterin synthase-related protein [Terracidiphilus sp.]